MGAKKKAPSNQRRDEIVAEVVDLLVPDGDDSDRLSSHVTVTSALEYLQRSGSLTKPVWGFSEANGKSISALSDKVRDLRKALSDTPNEALILLAGADPSDQFPSARRQQILLGRLRRIVATLGYLQRRCEELDANKVGVHRLANFSQRAVAEEAWRLMKNHMLTPASGISDSTYGMVATLLWEAVTGEAEKDLQRACKDALARAKAGELREWRGL
jgi:hypothetical protein